MNCVDVLSLFPEVEQMMRLSRWAACSWFRRGIARKKWNTSLKEPSCFCQLAGFSRLIEVFIHSHTASYCLHVDTNTTVSIPIPSLEAKKQAYIFKCLPELTEPSPRRLRRLVPQQSGLSPGYFPWILPLEPQKSPAGSQRTEMLPIPRIPTQTTGQSSQVPMPIGWTHCHDQYMLGLRRLNLRFTVILKRFQALFKFPVISTAWIQVRLTQMRVPCACASKSLSAAVSLSEQIQKYYSSQFTNRELLTVWSSPLSFSDYPVVATWLELFTRWYNKRSSSLWNELWADPRLSWTQVSEIPNGVYSGSTGSIVYTLWLLG
jgi:hypothetical protein